MLLSATCSSSRPRSCSAPWRLLTVAVAAAPARPGRDDQAVEGLLEERESAYRYVQVAEQSDGSRVLRLNEGVAVHSVWHRDSVLTGQRLGRPARPAAPRPAGAVDADRRKRRRDGRAGWRLYPDVEVTGVEIDPGDGGRAWPASPTTQPERRRRRRPAIPPADDRYDVVVVDACHQPTFRSTSPRRSSSRSMRERLNPGGVVALNVAGVPGDDRLSRAIGTRRCSRRSPTRGAGDRCASTS